jgi:hypothetical protein
VAEWLERISGAQLDLDGCVGGAPMTDHVGELRRTAAECLALAQTTTDPNTRAALIIMAQRLHDLASPAPIDFDAIVQGFNDQQMTRGGRNPVMQQQQQAQPKKNEDKE